MTQNEENRIIQTVLVGNSNAYEQLVLAHQNTVYTHALYLLQNRQDALDASQETFLRAYTNLRSFRRDSSFSVWLYRITHNCCIDILRRRRPAEPLSDENGIALDIPDFNPGPEEQLEKKELREAVQSAAYQLPQEFREVLLLREFAGLSYVEIAKVLEIEPATVKTRIFRARKKITEILRSGGNLSDQAPSDNTEIHAPYSSNMEGGNSND